MNKRTLDFFHILTINDFFEKQISKNHLSQMRISKLRFRIIGSLFPGHTDSIISPHSVLPWNPLTLIGPPYPSLFIFFVFYILNSRGGHCKYFVHHCVSCCLSRSGIQEELNKCLLKEWVNERWIKWKCFIRGENVICGICLVHWILSLPYYLIHLLI